MCLIGDFWITATVLQCYKILPGIPSTPEGPGGPSSPGGPAIAAQSPGKGHHSHKICMIKEMSQTQHRHQSTVFDYPAL